jgi:V/A-type H+-transporting ATPase subunit C
MSAWKYKKVMPRVLVSKLRLIPTKEIVDLTGSPLDRIHAYLLKTSYQREISELSPQQLTSISIEEALLKNFLRTIEEIALASPRDIRNVLNRVLMKFEAGALKAILRAKSAGLEFDEAMRYILPAGRLSASRSAEIVRNSRSVRDVIENISDMEYGAVLKEALPEYDNTGALLPLETAIDRYAYDRIMAATRKLRGRDRKIAGTVLGLEIDSMNIRVILRFKETGISEDWAVRHLLPVSDVFSHEVLCEALRAGEVELAIERLMEAAKFNLARDYQLLLEELMREYQAHRSLSRLESVLDRGLLKVNLRMLKRYTPFFNIGLILAFLNLKWFEMRNLRAIVRASDEKIPSETTGRLLILPS